MKIQFIKSPTGAFKLAYFPGDIVDFPDSQAEMLISAGMAEEYIPKISHETDIPGDFPGRAKLILYGLQTVDELKRFAQVEDFTTIPGIGKKLAEQIIQALK